MLKGEKQLCRKAKMSMLLSCSHKSAVSGSREVTLCAGHTTQSITGNGQLHGQTTMRGSATEPDAKDNDTLGKPGEESGTLGRRKL